MKNMRNKLIVVIEGPSGVGKDSVKLGLIKKHPNTYKKAPSIATREMRPGESQGDPYFFVDVEKFKQMLADGIICEHTQRHGSLRGISLALIDEILDAGLIPVKDADMVGVNALKQAYPNRVLTIFLKATREDVEARLRNRGDDESEVKKRLDDYDFMMQFEPEFDYSVENIVLNETIDKVHTIIQNHIREKL